MREQTADQAGDPEPDEHMPAAGTPTAGPAPAAAGPARGPGFAVAAAAVGVALLVNRVAPSVSPLMVAVLLGAAAANLGWLPERTAPGLRVVQRRVLRVGVALLGLQLSVQEALRLGGSSLLAVLAAVTVTFLATLWLGRRLRLPPGLSLLTAAGCALCGAAAIAAVQGASDAEEEDAAYALALVTLYGAVAMLLLPLLRVPLGLDAGTFGLWAGASVHEVAQVVAAASGAGPAALGPAVVTKLTRVLLLAPVVVMVAAAARSRAVRSDRAAARPPLLPLFVAAFLAAVGVRSLGVLPADWLGAAQTAATVLLSGAMFALGSAVRVRRLRACGPRALALGLAASVLIAVVAYTGLRMAA